MNHATSLSLASPRRVPARDELESDRHRVGRYLLLQPLAAGGMGIVHLGCVMGESGFSRLVAIKRLHPRQLEDEDNLMAFREEARLASRVRHPNVVQTLDLVHAHGELFMVMDYVQGITLAQLTREVRARRTRIPPAIAASILLGVLQGLHAAHEALDVDGEPLGMVHRDVSPQNILVGTDGVARLGDFGIATAAGQERSTSPGILKGKLGYFAPGQSLGRLADRTTDVYAAAICLWELLAGRRLFAECGEDIDPRMHEGELLAPSAFAPGIPQGLEAVVMGALSDESPPRYRSACEFAMDIEAAVRPANPWYVASWLRSVAHPFLREQSARDADAEALAAHAAMVTHVPRDVGPRGRAAAAEPTVSEAPTSGALGSRPSEMRLARRAPGATALEPGAESTYDARASGTRPTRSRGPELRRAGE